MFRLSALRPGAGNRSGAGTNQTGAGPWLALRGQQMSILLFDFLRLIKVDLCALCVC